MIDGIAVFGEHDDQTIEQLKRCAVQESVVGAALMADGHLGYSQPIGGVVAYRDAISPSGVGYDIGCIATGTLVTTADGYALPIEQVRAPDRALCWDGARLRPIRPNIGAIVRGSRAVVRVLTGAGRALVATDDHLVLTKDGWKPIGALAPGEKIAVSPYIGLAFGGPPETRAVPAPALLRLLGHACGDGHLTRDGQRVSFDTTDPVDGETIAADLRSLGYRGTLRVRERAPGRLAEVQVYCDSVELHRLLTDLGAPVGAKQWPVEPLPALFELPAWARAQFTSGFASAEMSTPRLEGMRRPNLQIKPAGEDDNAARFVARLLGSLGFATSVAPSGPARGARRDHVVQVLGGDREQVRFFAEVGFCYARRKREAAARVASVCWQRWAAVEARERAQAEARALRAAGLHHRAIRAEISARYGVRAAFVHHAIDSQRGAPRRPIGRVFAPDAQGEIAWATVTGVEPQAEPAPVYDVATGDPAESFLANGFVVHNCGNKAVRTPLREAELRPDVGRIMDEIVREIPFGVGRVQAVKQEHGLFDDPTWRDVPMLKSLRQLAQQQLGTVGSGNHYVDLFVDEEGFVWVGVHFGSRGFGHRTASGFLNLAAGRAFGDKAPGESMDQPPTVLPLGSALGQDYLAAMVLAGRYAYAGRDAVVALVLGILGTEALEEVHNHHNFAWIEEHGGERLVVVRKGATPNRPGQRSLIGGSMGDASVIVEGVASGEGKPSLDSTVHGAGRLMSRRRAAGKFDWKTRRHAGGEVSRGMMLDWVRRAGVELRGAGTDESPHVYKRLPDVLAAHASTLRVVHTLRPIGVAMAGEDVVDPYKD